MGYVPVNYIDKLERVDGVKGKENGTSEGKDEKVNGGEDENVRTIVRTILILSYLVGGVWKHTSINYSKVGLTCRCVHTYM